MKSRKAKRAQRFSSLATAVANLRTDTFETGRIKPLNLPIPFEAPKQLDMFEEAPKQEVVTRPPASEESKLATAKRRAAGVPTRRKTSKIPLVMRTVEGALLVLRNFGYSYVVEKQGENPESYKHGTISVAQKASTVVSKTGKKYMYPRGYLLNYLEPLMKNMQVNELVEAPAVHPDGTKLSLYALQSSASNVGNKLWGRSSVTTSMNAKNKTVEILRLY